MDRQNVIEPAPRNAKLEPMLEDKFIVKLLHKKCSVIHMARSQMSNFEQKYLTRRNRRSNSYCKKLWHRRYCILALLIIALLAWFCIMYGIVLGTMMCGRCNTNRYIPIIHVPGLKFLKKT